jgi:prepilin-type processing-associated H-X9-DG protein
VVIAIIAILAALLMPSLKSARESARAAQCMNRMKQIGTAVACYANDNADAVIGYARNDPAVNPLTGGTYEERIAPYLGAPGKQNGYNASLRWIAALRCPSIPISNPDCSMSHPASVPCGRTWDLNGLFTIAATTNPADLIPPKRMGEFASPSKVLYCTDGYNVMYIAPLQSGTRLPGQTVGYTVSFMPQEYDSIFFVHKGRTTALFLDNHVEMLLAPIPESFFVPPEYPRP